MNGNKVLVTGSEGMLGSNLVNLLSFGNTIGYSRERLDITDYQQVQHILHKEKPDIIIHTAAFTNVEACEIQPEKAYLVNTIGTQNLVQYALENDVYFVYISSTGIYGKEKNSAYTEFDHVNPTTVHHKSKYEAEKMIANHLSKYLILRTGWLFGGNISHQKNFVYNRYLEAKNKSIIYSDDSQIGNPTYVNNLVQQIELLLTNKQYGLYNCVDHADSVSRYDYVKKIIELFDMDCKVEIAPPGLFNRTAPVSHNESALNYKLKLQKLNVMKNWDDALYEYIKMLKREL